MPYSFYSVGLYAVAGTLRVLRAYDDAYGGRRRGGSVSCDWDSWGTAGSSRQDSTVVCSDSNLVVGTCRGLDVACTWATPFGAAYSNGVACGTIYVPYVWPAFVALSIRRSSPHDANRAAAGVIGLLLTMMHMVLLGALLALTPRTLYAHGESHTGLTPLEDQHLGGAIMLVGGGVSYLVGGLWLSVRLLRGNTIQQRGSQ